MRTVLVSKNNVDYFVTHKIHETSKEKVQEKIEWMFNRITSKTAREIAEPWYKLQ